MNNGLNMGSTPDWNTMVSNFDVNKFADEMAEVGAGYVIWTIHQGSKYTCSPNATLDGYTGYQAGQACSIRDLPNDLYTALNAKGIKLMLYVTGDGLVGDTQASAGLGWDGTANSTFISRYNNVLKTWADRYGSKVAGWWVDGCYSSGYLYNDTKLANYANTFKAATANPNTIVAFNNGLTFAPYVQSDDYIAGERNDFDQTCSSRWLGGYQWHNISFLGDNWWTVPVSKYTPSQMADYVYNAASNGGVVSIDVGVYRDGHISDNEKNVLLAIKDEVRNNVNPTNVMRVSVTNKDDTSITNKYLYRIFKTGDRVFQLEDYIEYDVKIVSNAYSGIGGIDVICTDGTYLRGSGCVDQNGITGHPNSNISSYANGTWYHRKLAIPSSFIGKTSNKWLVASENDNGYHKNTGKQYSNVSYLSDILASLKNVPASKIQQRMDHI